MRSRVPFTVLVALTLACMLSSRAAATVVGDLDLSYGNDGVGVVLDIFSDIATETEAMGLQSDGKLVVTGQYWELGIKSIFLARYDDNGTLDPTFGTDGLVITHVGSGNSGADAMVVQPDDKIVVAGFAVGTGGVDFALVRYLPDGALDATFGVGGKVLTAVAAGSLTDAASALVLQPNGYLVAAGTASLGSNHGDRLVRYLPDGTLDVTFGAGGIAVGHDGYSLTGGFVALARQIDGKLVLGSNGRPMRFNADGTIDTAFGPGGDGFAEQPGTEEISGMSSLALLIQPDGKIFAAGDHITTLAVSRWTSDGMVDPAFGPPDVGGLVLLSVGEPTPTTLRVARQANGRLLLIADGITIIGLTDSGALDPTFGPFGDGYSPPGVPQLDLGDGASSFFGDFHALAIQPDGRLLAAGWGHYYPKTSGSTSLLIARYDASGCSGMAKARLNLSRLGTPTGDEKLLLTGTLALAASTPLDPIANGVRLLVDEGTYDLTIPGGLSWTTNSKGTQWKYKNKAGLQGITLVQLKRSIKFPDQMAVKVQGKDGDFDAWDSLDNVSVIFDVTAMSPTQCGTAQWPGDPLAIQQCEHKSNDAVMKCK